MKPIDYILLGLVLVLVGLAVWIIVHRKKQGKCNCGCDCGHCAQSCPHKK